MTPFIVKNAALRRRRSRGETSACSTASSTATTATPSQYHDAEREADADEREQHDRQRVQQRAPQKTPRDAEARRHRMQPLAPVDVDVEQRVEEVEAGDPGRDGAAELPRLERQLPGDRDPRAHRREPVDGAEPEMAEPRERASGTGRRRSRRPGSATASARRRSSWKTATRKTTSDATQKSATCARVSSPDGSSRDAVRGLRASSSASISRFSPIASDRAPTIATVIQSRSCARGNAVDGEQRADVGERQREQRVLDLHEPREAQREDGGRARHVCRCAVASPASSRSACSSAGRSTA